jgi:[acyl-carrier-protein] S-malonyltransferase
MTALLFPGQGTQRPGMGQALRLGFPEAVDGLLAEAARQSPHLTTLMRRGPMEELSHTRNAQLAVTTVNLCALAVLRAHDVDYDAVAGHSVGLLSALVAADALGAQAAMRLAAVRGALMGALPAGGTMVSVVGIDPESAADVVRDVSAETGLPVVVGLVNGPESVVLSGSAAAVERAAETFRRDGVRVTPLAVSHAFHSPLMRPALAEWRRIVDDEDLRSAAVPVVADITGEPVVRAADLRELLVEQMITSVRWDRVCGRLQASGESDCVEAGDSKMLRGLARPYPQLRVTSMAMPETLTHLRRHGSLPKATAGLGLSAAGDARRT